jgi:hypothetical protein
MIRLRWVDTLTVYVEIKFQLQSSNGSVVSAVEPKDNNGPPGR